MTFFYFLLHFWNVWNERSIMHKKRKNMLGSRFFALKVGAFWSFFNMLATCHMSCIMLASYPMLQNTKFTTKSKTMVLRWQCCDSFDICQNFILYVLLKWAFCIYPFQKMKDNDVFVANKFLCSLKFSEMKELLKKLPFSHQKQESWHSNSKFQPWHFKKTSTSQDLPTLLLNLQDITYKPLVEIGTEKSHQNFAFSNFSVSIGKPVTFTDFKPSPSYLQWKKIVSTYKTSQVQESWPCRNNPQLINCSIPPTHNLVSFISAVSIDYWWCSEIQTKKCSLVLIEYFSIWNRIIFVTQRIITQKIKVWYRCMCY